MLPPVSHFYQLSERLQHLFANESETAMGIQIGRLKDKDYVLIVSGRLAIRFGASDSPPILILQEFLMDMLHMEQKRYADALENWMGRLPVEDSITPTSGPEALSVLQLIHLGPIAPLPPRLWRPSHVYGHLPFHGICSGKDVFYRFEPYPTSLRINPLTLDVAADTYAAPASERPFTPTGLSAVARFALPSLLPAIYVWELTPPHGTRLDYGASVPLYGQSGGGVEVMFPMHFANSVPFSGMPSTIPIL